MADITKRVNLPCFAFHCIFNFRHFCLFYFSNRAYRELYFTEQPVMVLHFGNLFIRKASLIIFQQPYNFTLLIYSSVRTSYACSYALLSSLIRYFVRIHWDCICYRSEPSDQSLWCCVFKTTDTTFMTVTSSDWGLWCFKLNHISNTLSQIVVSEWLLCSFLIT